jgi:high-affinity iron transporter
MLAQFLALLSTSLPTMVIVFREIMEAGLVVSIVMAATRSVPGRGIRVIYGIIGGVAGACVVAVFANSISNALSGFGQEYFNVGILSVAVVMLTIHNVWMARHGREIAAEMKAVGVEVSAGRRPLTALAVVVGIAVLREGSEIVLSVAMGTVTYLGILRIPNRHLFAATSLMLALLAAGMAAQAVNFLEQAQAITSLQQIVWNSSHILSGGSVVGKALHALIGYNDRPTLMQLIAYLATLAVTFILTKLFGHAPQQPKRELAPS